MKKAIVKHAAGEVTGDAFVTACVTFQQAKRQLSEMMNGASAEQCDVVSQGVYGIVNKALRAKQKDDHGDLVRAVKNGERPAFRDAIAKAVRGRKTFTSADVIIGLKKKGLTPRAENLLAYVSSTLSANQDLFKRVDRGVYQIKGRRKLRMKTKEKALPAPTP